MNIVNLTKLRDHLLWLNEETSTPEVGINMYAYFTKVFKNNRYFDISKHGCQTIACIAGQVAILNKQPMVKSGEICSYAQKWLDLTTFNARYLFNGKFSNKKFIEEITLEDVIAELNFMIKNGSVNVIKLRNHLV